MHRYPTKTKNYWDKWRRTNPEKTNSRQVIQVSAPYISGKVLLQYATKGSVPRYLLSLQLAATRRGLTTIIRPPCITVSTTCASFRNTQILDILHHLFRCPRVSVSVLERIVLSGSGFASLCLVVFNLYSRVCTQELLLSRQDKIIQSTIEIYSRRWSGSDYNG